MMKRYSVSVSLPSWQVIAENEDEARAGVKARIRRDYGAVTVAHANITIDEIYGIKGRRRPPPDHLPPPGLPYSREDEEVDDVVFDPESRAAHVPDSRRELEDDQ